jgi:hypothetical protein
MMAQFQVGPPKSGDDPIWADQAKDLPCPEL